MPSLIELISSETCEFGTNSQHLCDLVTSGWSEVVESSENGSATRLALSAFLSKQPLVAKRSWCTSLSMIYASSSWVTTCDTDTVRWLWAFAFETCRDVFEQFDECQRSQQSRMVDATRDHDFPHTDDLKHDCPADDAELLMELSKLCVSWLTGAHNIVLARCREVASTTEPDPINVEFICKVSRECLCLDDHVQHNFPLMNAVWKALGQVVGMYGPVLPPVDTAVDENSGFPFSEAVERLLSHADNSLDALLIYATPCEDTKIATKHTRVLRFLCSHLTAIFKDAVMLRHTASQWTRVVLATVRLLHVTCCPQVNRHPVVDALRQFVTPVFTSISVSLFQIDDDLFMDWIRDALQFLTRAPFSHVPSSDEIKYSTTLSAAAVAETVAYCTAGACAVFLLLCDAAPSFRPSVVTLVLKAVPQFWQRVLTCVPVLLSPEPPLDTSSSATRFSGMIRQLSTSEPDVQHDAQRFTWDGALVALCRLLSIDFTDDACIEVAIAYCIELSTSGHPFSEAFARQCCFLLASIGAPITAPLLDVTTQAVFQTRAILHKQRLAEAVGAMVCAIPCEAHAAIAHHIPTRVSSESVHTLHSLAALLVAFPFRSMPADAIPAWVGTITLLVKDIVLTLEFSTQDGHMLAVVAVACVDVLNAVLTCDQDAIIHSAMPTTLRHRALGCALGLLHCSVTSSTSDHMLRCGFLSSAKFVVHCRAFLEPAQHAALFSVIRHGLQIYDCALEVSRLLGSLGDIPFPLDVEERMSTELRELFGVLFRHSNPAVVASACRSFAKFAECSRMDGVQSLVPEDCQAALFHWLTPHRYDSPSLQHSDRDTMLVWEAATLLAQPNSVDDETLKDAAAAVKASVNRLRSLVQFAENLGNRGDVIAEDLVAAVNAMASLVPDAVLPQN